VGAVLFAYWRLVLASLPSILRDEPGRRKDELLVTRDTPRRAAEQFGSAVELNP
jgi:hypothetical protein